MKTDAILYLLIVLLFTVAAVATFNAIESQSIAAYGMYAEKYKTVNQLEVEAE